MKKIFGYLPIIFILFVVLFFFRQFVFQAKLPIPSDTIVGLYHPFRDLFSHDYPNGIPFKNFLITDPVRQQFPWRELAISILKRFELPLWNPYSFSGTPLLANMQSATFYPLNALFFLLPFDISWSILIVLELLLGGLFLYLYLNNLRINKWASLLGSISFSFSGFFVAWMEWGTMLHVGMWLPLILLSTDNIFTYLKYENSKLKTQSSKLQLKNKNLIIWSLVYVFSLISSFFAGHLQIFFYLFVVSFMYFIARWIRFGKKRNTLLLFIILNSLFIILTSAQWIPTLQFILYSARDIDQATWQQEGWFIPWQNLIQFIAPDFFGNTSTLNYWGAWNYGELIGYIGILPFVMAIFALFFRRDKKTLFYGVIFFLSLIFSFPTIFAKIPYILEIPFLSTIQPTRLLFITDFSLAVLVALGFDYFFRHKKTIVYPLIFMTCIFVGLWFFVVFGNQFAKITLPENIIVAKRNLVFPTLVLVISATLLLILIGVTKVHRRFTIMIYIIIVAITVFDLLRFGLKFTPFTNSEYLFPNTQTLSFLQQQKGYFRIMTTDSRILPPNFSVIYRLQSLDGYDPLYLRRYAELIAASERGKPDIKPPFGFNRMITPHNYNSKIIDLLGVKYILSLSDLSSSRLKKVFREGQTRVYENKNVMPRVFFAEQVLYEKDKDDVMNAFFRGDIDLRKIAILQLSYQKDNTKPQPAVGQLGAKRTVGKARILYYSENRVLVEVENPSDAGVLIFTDAYYPTWRAKINNDYEIPIFQVDYNFRGISVSRGKHKIEFYNSLF